MATISKLLKEWAIVCRALADGRQIFIARKGGISEDEGEFVVENREFFLFPTYLHQNRDEVAPPYHLELQLVQEEEPKDHKVHIDLFAKVTDLIKITDPLHLSSLQEHIWGTLLKNRFEWGSERGLQILILKVFKLPQTITIPLKPRYMGCKSWVTLEEPLPLPKGLQSVLSEIDFTRRRQRVLEVLK